VGQRTPTETLFGIVAAFVEQRTWTQADLARKLETQTATIRRRLGELQAGGFKLERSEEPPHVYWSVPKNWFPGALPLQAEEVTDLLRLLARGPAERAP
jgi:predicted DNA-binding transcriptional regulator YafY